jgi:hypothetical protein
MSVAELKGKQVAWDFGSAGVKVGTILGESGTFEGDNGPEQCFLVRFPSETQGSFLIDLTELDCYSALL